ncbi:MAG: hypothetical protein A2W79_10715 [Pseudomonadales bacterium RIFCSPLOWO2_12_60_38]|jgi:hypothetical protein|uniref:Uncharacterized protein n=4 Tax=Pseudomonas TaxID=286 RepID=A0A109LLW7_PSEFL|nr:MULTISPECIES: hypothetical protein [Pseudomonas]ETK41279.1 hypothetical protein H098_12445 [Pseudomonas fluorescens FH5]OHC31936.1 MAG: hypothetical protein A2W79_10715 [Pseudomonadales bacterium RIFCSPLOWO2_12_60_38]OHC39993.1 MAG: hypothetical protein A3G72_18215 [Pseudomonadales bacterium RIFCSPLOWO2_12_FULL_59_450]AVJ23236.1 hypothetical protein CLM72_16445 [Pseudomonas sp. MYb193]KWV72912.1 hypothetical protein PFLuk1_02062 [Pseudomonas fluorescens]
MSEHKQPPPGTPDPNRTPGEEERDNDALRPNDPKERGPDNDVERVEEDLENLHDRARPL